MENSYVVRCGVGQICMRNFTAATFFNEWLEKHVIMRNQLQAP